MKKNTVIKHIQLAWAAEVADKMPLEAGPVVKHEKFGFLDSTFYS